MPNWCEVTYKVTGKDINKIYKLYNTLKENKDLRLNDDADIWWGDIVYQLGGNVWHKNDENKFFTDEDKKMYDKIKAEHPETLDKNPIYCRGWIVDMEIDDNVLSIYYNSAWQELSEVRHFLEANLDIDEIIFYAEEPGMEIYATNDIDETYFGFNFVCNHIDNGAEVSDYYYSEQDILTDASNYYNHDFKSIEELEKFTNDLDYDDSGFFVHEVRRVNG